MEVPTASRFTVDWLDCAELACSGRLGVSGMPGTKRGPLNARVRDMAGELDVLAAAGVTDVVSLVSDEELKRHKTTTLFEELGARGWGLHRFPLDDGEAPSEALAAELVQTLHTLLQNDKKRVVLQCVASERAGLVQEGLCKGGLGRACTVAALYLQEASGVSPAASIERVRAARGPGAIQTVRQYNCVMEYKPHVLSRG